MSDENSFEKPTVIEPKDANLGQVSSPFNYAFVPYSITILRLNAK